MFTKDEYRSLARVRAQVLRGTRSDIFTAVELRRLRFYAYLYNWSKLDDGPGTSWGDRHAAERRLLEEVLGAEAIRR